MRIKPTNAHFLIKSIALCDPNECMIWPFGKDQRGYGKLSYQGKMVKAHRVAFMLKYGKWPLPEGRHTCDVPACFNPHHIIEGTRQLNWRDCIERQRTSKGIKRWNARLTDERVSQIRSEYKPHDLEYGGIALAKKYGVSRTTISELIHGKIWRHVSGQSISG